MFPGQPLRILELLRMDLKAEAEGHSEQSGLGDPGLRTGLLSVADRALGLTPQA